MPKRRTITGCFALLLVGLLLVGCASQADKTSLFKLDNASAGTAGTPNTPRNAPVLVVKTVSLASYLNRGGIVYQTASHRVSIAANNRWASPLSEELTDILANTLETRLAKVDVERSIPAKNSDSPVVTLTMNVSKFLGRYDGKAIIAGRWQLTNGNDEQVATEQFNRRIALSKDGYPALVDSLAEGWRLTSRVVSDNVRKRIKKSN